MKKYQVLLKENQKQKQLQLQQRQQRQHHQLIVLFAKDEEDYQYEDTVY